jgi:hypothetical protein
MRHLREVLLYIAHQFLGRTALEDEPYQPNSILVRPERVYPVRDELDPCLELILETVKQNGLLGVLFVTQTLIQGEIFELLLEHFQVQVHHAFDQRRPCLQERLEVVGQSRTGVRVG